MKKSVPRIFAAAMAAVLIMLSLAACAAPEAPADSAPVETSEKREKTVKIEHYYHNYVVTVDEMDYPLCSLFLEAYDSNSEQVWDYSSAPCNGNDALNYSVLEYIGMFGDLVLINEQYICRSLEKEIQNGTFGSEGHLRVLDASTGAVITDNEFDDGFGAYKYDEEKEILYFTSTNGSALYALGKDGNYLWVCESDVDAFWSSDVSLEEDRIFVHFEESGDGDGPVDLAYSYDGKLIGIAD